MNGVKTVDLQRLYDPLDTLERERLHQIQRVSNNLGVYFLFCLFGSAILALFLCRSMQALQTSLSFFVLRRQVLADFYVSINFYRRVTLDFK